MIGIDPAKVFGPQIERAVKALEAIAAAAKQMGEAAAVQQEMIQRALDSVGETRPDATVTELRPVPSKLENPKGGK